MTAAWLLLALACAALPALALRRWSRRPAPVPRLSDCNRAIRRMSAVVDRFAVDLGRALVPALEQWNRDMAGLSEWLEQCRRSDDANGRPT